ncbi:MAG: hypothetical protein GF364_18175 [Candidatus Lokiarchaeota archaeon]|nr:hypothetical protein [Candidatus Lokiarchaeota archaeon]
MKKSSKLIIITFFSIFIIKSLFGIFINGPYLLSEEACSIVKATHFIKYFEIKSCTLLTSVPITELSPLYSMIISPIYIFFSGSLAYKLVLILNNLLISSLIFPLYKIFKKFISKKSYLILLILVFNLLPQIIIAGYTATNTVLLIFLSIWFLYFYQASFEKNSIKYKTLSILFAFLTIFTNPIGLILPFSLIVNELILNKNKKSVALIYLPGAFILSYITITIFFPNLRDLIDMRLFQLINFNFYKHLIVAIKNQLNSYIIASYYIPIFLILSFLFSSKSKFVLNTRYFLLTFLISNFIIGILSVDHYYEEELRTAFLTKVIQNSIIYIFIYAVILFTQLKKIKFNLVTYIIHIILVSSLLFIEYSKIRLDYNLDIAFLYNTSISSIVNNLVQSKNYVFAIIFALILILNLLLIKNKKKELIIVYSTILICTGVFTSIWLYNFTKFTPETTKLFKDKNEKILFIGDIEDNTAVSNSYWKLLVLSSGIENIKFNFLTINQLSKSKETITLHDSEKDYINENFDYLISNLKFDIPVYKTLNKGGTGSNLNEYIYKLN